MDHPGDDERKAAWSSYWAAGGLHSCIGSYEGNYGGAIGAFWHGVFASLAPGQRVLDLATGNGALPLMLADRGEVGQLQIDAVDLAQLAPGWHDSARYPQVRFHAGVAMESLPFPDGRFDLITSQFGFEYADRHGATREALRVLAPDGRLALVMHHAGSVLVEVGRSELADQDFLLAPDGLLDAVRDVLPWFARARAGENLSGHAVALASRGNYNRAVQEATQRTAASRAPELLAGVRDAVHALLARTGADPGPSLEALEGMRQAMRQARLRTAEMIGHALDEQAAGALVAELGQARPAAQVRCEPLSQAEGLLGWALRMAPG